MQAYINNKYREEEEVLLINLNLEDMDKEEKLAIAKLRYAQHNPLQGGPGPGRPRKKEEEEKKLSPEEAFKALKDALASDPEMRLKVNREAIETEERRRLKEVTTKNLKSILDEMHRREEAKKDMPIKYYGWIKSRRNGPITGYQFANGREYEFPIGATLLQPDEEGNYILTSITRLKEFPL